MPTISENLETWGGRDWSAGGDEWSVSWGGTPSLWWSTLFPRVRGFLPTGSLLEIAPGAGRVTQFLKDLCDRMDLVDLAEPCIEACRERFDAESHISYHVNDGRSLGMLAGGSVDFAISFDSLVHVEDEVIGAYLKELGRVLSADGAAFLHHSNIGAFVDPASGELTVENEHWRATSVSADRFVELCGPAGLECRTQELVNWGGQLLNDCFSLVVPKGSSSSLPLRRVENPDFMREAELAKRVAGLYAPEELEEVQRRRRRRKGLRHFLRRIAWRR